MNLRSQDDSQTPGGTQATLDVERRRNHPHCFVCSNTNGDGLKLKFTVAADGSVWAAFQCEESLEGYAGIVHGGVVSSLLDGAMTNCLFARGIAAVTAELTVRFRHSLRVGEAARVRAWVARSTPHLHFLAAEIMQSGAVAATAQAKFRRPSAAHTQAQDTP